MIDEEVTILSFFPYNVMRQRKEETKVGFFNGSNAWIIILVLILLFSENNSGCGCNSCNNCGCGC